MSANTTNYLVREIAQYLKHSPEAANELLTAVAEGMRLYKSDVQQTRSTQAVNGISLLYSLITKKRFNRTDLACVLPALFITMPNNFVMIDGDNILKLFLEGVNREHRTSLLEYDKYCQWIYSCRGSEVAEWFDNLMYWAIKEKLIPEGFGGGDA